jgi:hypothetical protein
MDYYDFGGLMTRMLEILDRMRELEADLEHEVAATQERWHYRFEAGKVRFESEVSRRHQLMKMSIRRYLRESDVPSMLSAPIVYSVLLPFMLIDVWVSLYQRICFPIYGIARVRRADYIAVDRWKLAYLNTIEKANCDYCGYVNGLLSYVREVSARTEQYWCPIKHARRVLAPHSRYRHFVDYGDAEGYKRELPVLRDALRDEKQP